jgi:hypothetical protein
MDRLVLVVLVAGAFFVANYLLILSSLYRDNKAASAALMAVSALVFVLAVMLVAAHAEGSEVIQPLRVLIASTR